MKTIRFWGISVIYAWKELCQRRWLLAELVLLYLVLPKCVGPAAQELLSDGVSFSAITLAVTAPEGDPIPGLLEQYMGNMRDIRQYCTFQAMDEAGAAAALESGEATAILVLPENFIQGVMDGSNPDIQLVVPSDRPLESLLTLWVGQSAADILSSLQAGVYAVLDLYGASAPDGLSWNQAMTDINLRYIQWTLNRQNLFALRQVSATQVLPVRLHYELSMLAYLGLSLAPLFSGIYGSRRLTARRRLRCLGRGSLLGYLGDLTACTAAVFLLTAVPVAILARDAILFALGAAAVFALFCAVFGSLCCLVTAGAAGCGGLAFAVALTAMGTAGGILPPVMLPQTLRELSWLSPVAWLRTIAALPAGYPAEHRVLIAAAAAALLMAVLSAWLYHRRVMRQEAV